MPNEPTPELILERNALIGEIYAAFADVSRTGAVSWSEARVKDRWGSDEERRLARRSDREANWQGLVDSPDWPGNYTAAWSFLDPFGFRYYLAPALVRWLKTGDDADVGLSLDVGPENSEYGRRWLSALDLRQKHCVRRVLEYDIALDSPETSYPKGMLREALNSYWAALPQ